MFEFKQAVREKTGLLIGLAGPSGSGKTYSAMRLASGIVGEGNRFAVIDTENKRSRHYAQFFQFDVVDLAAPYRPASYSDALTAAIQAKYGVVIIDSMSHEHAGEGGVLEWQATNLAEFVRRAKERGSNDPEWKLEERLGPKSWIEPKMERKKTIQKINLASMGIPIIVCFRAEEKLFIKKNEQGKTAMVTEWAPVCGKEYPYEMTCFFMLSYDKPGIPIPLKLQEQHRTLFPTGKLLDESAGKAVAEWAKGGVSPKAPVSPDAEKPPDGEKLATQGQIKQIQIIFNKRGITEREAKLEDLTGFCNRPIHSSKDLTFEEAHDYIQAHLEEG